MPRNSVNNDKTEWKITVYIGDLYVVLPTMPTPGSLRQQPPIILCDSVNG